MKLKGQIEGNEVTFEVVRNQDLGYQLKIKKPNGEIVFDGYAWQISDWLIVQASKKG